MPISSFKMAYFMFNYINNFWFLLILLINKCWFVDFVDFQQMLICWFVFVEFVDLLKFVEKSTKIKNQQAILKMGQQKQKSTNDFRGFLEPCSCDDIHVIIINTVIIVWKTAKNKWPHRNSLELVGMYRLSVVWVSDMEFKRIKSSEDSDRCKRMGNQYQCIF